jgi:small GTP-binding protein
MTVPINQKNHTVILQDTAGQEEFDKLRQLAYKETDVFVLCYSVDDVNSWDNVKEKWAPELKRCCPRAKLILAGTKSDLVSKRVVSEKDGTRLAKQIKADGFIENSAKLGKNIDETICLAITVYMNSITKRDSSSSCALI